MKTRSIVFLVLAICFGGGLLIVGSVASMLYYTYRNAENVTSPRIDAIFAAAADGTFGDTYKTETSPLFQSACSAEQYVKIGEGIRLKLGKLKAKSLTSFNTRKLNGVTSTEVVYNATFAKGPGNIRAQLVKAGDRWLFNALYVDSPLLLELASVKCEKCGEPHAPGARFCPACGAELAGDAAVEKPETQTNAPTEP